MTIPARTERSTAVGLYAKVKKAGNQLQDQLVAKALQTSSAGLILRQKEPANLETPLDQVDSYLTPTELFYIRSHYPAPRLELNDRSRLCSCTFTAVLTRTAPANSSVSFA